MSKKYRYRDIPGFPGDAKFDDEMHHAAPIGWSKKMTVWSTVMIVGFIIFATAIYYALV